LAPVSVTLQHPDGRVFVHEIRPERRRVSVELSDPRRFVPYPTFETNYPVELIEEILVLRGPAQPGYSILREEDPSHLKSRLENYILSYRDAADFDGERVLDFGCGSGSSTVALGELLGRTEIVAVDLEETNVAVARVRARYRGIENVSFLVSPGPMDLPPELGTFDVIFLTAVCEHLLPRERTTVVPKLWSLLRPGGVLFVSETPHRYYPVEYHTTGLPLLNYMPSGLAYALTRRFSKRVPPTLTWEQLLRGGVRGCTEGELLRILRSGAGGEPLVLTPSKLGHHDQVDIWFSESMARRPLPVKPVLRTAFKAVSRLTGADFVPTFFLAIEKRAS